MIQKLISMGPEYHVLQMIAIVKLRTQTSGPIKTIVNIIVVIWDILTSNIAINLISFYFK